MKFSPIFIFLFLLVPTPFVIAAFGFDNPALPKLVPTPIEGIINQNITNINQTIINNINQFDQSLNTTDSVQFIDLTLTGNLTLGQKITFALGEIIDNIVDGWITITGNLNVTENVTADFFFGDGSKLTGISGGSGIWTNVSGTASYFDNVNISGIRDIVQLTINAHSTQTSNIFEVKNGTGTTLLELNNDGQLTVGEGEPDSSTGLYFVRTDEQTAQIAAESSEDAWIAFFAKTSTGPAIHWDELKDLRIGASETLAGGGFNVMMLIEGDTGFVGVGTSIPNRLFHAELLTAFNNQVKYPLRITHISSAGVAVRNKFGVGMEFEIEAKDDSDIVAGIIEVLWRDNTINDEVADMVFKLTDSGAVATEKMRLTGVGDLSVRRDGNFTGNLSAQNITAFGTLNVTGNATFQNDVIIQGTLFGGSPVKISGGLNVSGDITIDNLHIHDLQGILRIEDSNTLPTTESFFNAQIEFFGLGTDGGNLGYSGTSAFDIDVASENDFRILMAGSEKFKITIPGNVGINTSTPKNLLNVLGIVNFTSNFIVDESTFFVDSVNDFTGFGTALPGAEIHISASSPNLFIDAIGGTTSSLRFRDGTTQSWRISRFPGNGDLRIVADLADLNVMTFRTSGKVGFNTTDPSALVDLDGGGGRGIIEIDGSTGGCLKIRDTDDLGFTYITTLNGVMNASTTAC